MLKFENVVVGTTVKAYDHEPFPGRDEMFLQGEVVRHHTDNYGTKFLVVVPTIDETFGSDHNRIGLEVFVPMEMDLIMTTV